MCGIAGFLDLERRSGSQELEALGRAMAATLTHRGPDAHGVWADAEAGVQSLQQCIARFVCSQYPRE